MNKRSVGSEKEALAWDYLETKGYHMLEKNFRCRIGEIDLIGMDGSYLCFIEVKYRKNTSMGTPWDAVTGKKQSIIRRVSEWYCMSHHLEQVPIRFDVVGILGDEITLLKQAF
ncbi:MAG: YraN family protein [Lachnospiraceae bacterium]|nr:YraN family protein [Lachnospiraceae bacterium]